MWRLALLLCLCPARVLAVDEASECDEQAPGSCLDHTALLQSKLAVADQHDFEEAEVDIFSVEHQTTVEVDAATTKVIEGVPVYNYHLANPGGMHPSALELSESKTWLIEFGDSISDDDEVTFCKDPPGNSACTPSGHPSEGGVPFVIFKGTESELKTILAKHKALKPSFVEPDAPVSTVPEIDEKEEGDSFLELGEQAVSSWGLDRIDDLIGKDGSYAMPAGSSGGAGAHVYIADTGIRTSHDDFEGRAIPAIESLSSTTKECNGDVNCAYDRHGHGTHCAGTVGGKLYGVAKKTALYAVKVLGDRGGGSFAGIVKSVDWIASKGKKPAVWSASLGGKGVMHSIERTFAVAMTKGVTISVAAGNSRGDACGYSPAFAPSALTVGATSLSGTQDVRAGFSNYGKCVDLFAPGVSIRSASAKSNTGSATMSGTSMACPHVSGVAALFLGDNPGMSPKGLEAHMKSTAHKDLVKDSRSPSASNLFLYTGTGKGGPPSNPPPTGAPTTTTTLPPSSGGQKCSFESGSTPWCGIWEQSKKDKFDWTRRNSRTPSYGTGPSKASDGSYFLFTEMSGPRRNGDTAALRSKQLSFGSASTLQFDYHMFGCTGMCMGTLEVTVHTTKGSVSVWKKGGANLGDKWNTARIPLAQFSGQTGAIELSAKKGTAGNSWQGDIAIDNAIVNVGGGAPPATTMPPPPPSPTTMPPPPPATTPPPSAPHLPALQKIMAEIKSLQGDVAKLTGTAATFQGKLANLESMVQNIINGGR